MPWSIWLSHLMGTSWQHWMQHWTIVRLISNLFSTIEMARNGIMIQRSPLTNDVSYVECVMFFKNQPALRCLRDLLSSDLGFFRWGTNPSQTAGLLASFSPSICASKTGVCTLVRWDMLGKGLGKRLGGERDSGRWRGYQVINSWVFHEIGWNWGTPKSDFPYDPSSYWESPMT